MTGPAFRAYVEQFLAPALQPGDVVVLDNLAAHKIDGVHQAITRAGAFLLYLPALQPGPEPDRAAVRQAQGAAQKGCGAHEGRTLVDHRPPHRGRPTRGMRQLPRPHGLWLWFHLR